MTTPGYTSSVASDAGALLPRRPSSGAPQGRPSPISSLARWAAPIGRRPGLVQVGLDVAAVAFILAAFLQVGLSAEFLFHCVFVLLVLHAFLFGLRGTLIRIALVSVPLLGYAEARLFGLDEPPLELTEWPLMFVIAAVVAWMADRRTSTSRRYAALFRQASERLLTVEEDERRRIAGELHDSVGQVLTALTLNLDAAAAESEPGRVRRRISSARALADTALAGTRDLSHRIRPARLEERGLVAAVSDLATQSGFPVVVEAADSAREARIGPTATVELFRIVQEALANAARHSGASRARVSLARLDGHLTVEIADDGCGFDPDRSPGTGIGLAGMVERARLLGGRLSIESARRSGTRVSVSIPIGDTGVPG